MKTNKEPLRSAMDRRLSFLDELPSCRAALYRRIAQEEAPVMKKKPACSSRRGSPRPGQPILP